MRGVPVVCPHCNATWPEEGKALAGLAACPGCNRNVTIAAFPAFDQPVASGASPETVLLDGEANCFYHPQNRAVIPCGACGRFLCALCDLEIRGRHLCPACLESSRRQGRLAELDTRRTLYDDGALTLAILPLLFWPLTLVTAPTAMGLAIASFYRPSSLIPRTRVRAYLALVLGLLEVAGWTVLFFNVFLAET